ncbi:uncharacterized protein LOC121366469 [Gigantopelta aegis]|uniref:uncharacterized protein LOC121366469 n=1 Tax=Gigantopelta aegis TaxID=1735272 RepID=UPI001B88D711|nr:uncharacterized protein LOC121366469 [Gigantopelta aegis]
MVSTCPVATKTGRLMSLLQSPKNLRWMFGFLLVLVCLVYLASNSNWCQAAFVQASYSSDRTYSVWPPFLLPSQYNQDWFITKCVIGFHFSITDLSSILQQWSKSKDPSCRNLFKRFSSVYDVENRKAPLLFPGPFQSKVRLWVGNNEKLFQQAFHQEVINVYNYFTREHTIYNPLRDKRPITKPKEPEEVYIERLISESKNSCDFCHYRNFTAEHTMHRLESKFAFTASNAFKMDKWHALFALKKHHPLNWSLDEYMDLMNLSVKWFQAASTFDESAQYPVIVWDILPHAGASQVHPHMHGFIDPTHYHGVVEMWRTAGEDYYRQSGKNYFQDLVNFYSALGLTVEHGNAVAFANLVPKKDNEIVVMSPVAGESFFQLIFFVLRAFIDDLNKYCISMGFGLPALKSSHGRIPAYARIITRGPVADVRTDMSSLELFAATNVNIDPWKAILYIKDSVERRSKNL